MTFSKTALLATVEINKKYTWNALMNAPDTFAFLDTKNIEPTARCDTQRPQPNTLKPAKRYYPDIKAQFTTSAAIELDLIATYLHGD
ncbi:hypothetical protein BCU36_025385, partial [Vibrio lentus]|uniref:hypothetical protein n=1 Tax=Vibrio lentus TaxID=136468 RepID=UPI0039A74C43